MVAESVHLNFLEQKLFSAEIVHFNNLKTCQCRKCNHEKIFGCRNRAYFKKLTRGRDCSFFLSHVETKIYSLCGVLPSAKRPEGRAARGRPGNVWQHFSWPKRAKTENI